MEMDIPNNVTKEIKVLKKDFKKFDRDDHLVKTSFYITYAFLITTGTITFIEAIRTKDIKIRNILNLETCISIVAAFFYGQSRAGLLSHAITRPGMGYKCLCRGANGRRPHQAFA